MASKTLSTKITNIAEEVNKRHDYAVRRLENGVDSFGDPLVGWYLDNAKSDVANWAPYVPQVASLVAARDAGTSDVKIKAEFGDVLKTFQYV